jgi:gluconate 2-dehydrogenase gamma chain
VASDEAVPLPGVLPGASAEPAYRFLSPHQAAVLDAASRRLDLDPQGDPHELHVTMFVDRLLSVFRVAPGTLAMVGSLRQRVAELRDQYRSGIALLDELAGGDFTAVPRLCQDLILSHARVAPFASVLFDHIVEAIYTPSNELPSNAGHSYHETG